MKQNKKTALILTLLLLIAVTGYIMAVSAQSPVIVVSPSPAVIQADGETHEIIVVALQTENGQPYVAPRDTPVHITSSNINIGTPDEFITIPEGKSYAKAAFTTRKSSGITIITASSPGYVTGSEYLQVSASNINAQLKVYASPSSQPNVIGETGRVFVQIMDNFGQPLIPSEDVEITLTSSNHSLVTVTQDLVIEKGSNYAYSEFLVASTLTGELYITAQAQGYTPGTDQVFVYERAPVPESVALFFSPDTILPDGEPHSTVTVQLQDNEGNPASATTDTTIYLSSSNTNVATIDETVVITSGTYKTTANIMTYSENGETIISASSPGMTPATETFTAQGKIPELIEMYIFPDIMVADGSESDIITIQFQDEEGNPITVGTDAEVYLTSSNPTIGDIPSSVFILHGTSYTTVTFTSTGVAGETNILASMMGVIPSEKTFQTVTKEMNITLSTPTAIMINQTFTVQVQLSSGGLPLPGAEIEWTALGGVIISEESETDDDGIARAEIVQKYDTLRLKASASKTGYEPNEVQRNVQITQEIETDELTITLFGRQIQVFHILIGLGVLIAIILAVYVYIKYRNTRDDEPEDLEIYT